MSKRKKNEVLVIKDAGSIELEYKKKYEFLVHFLHHEFFASISTFQGLVQLLEANNDPYLKYFQIELDKLKARIKVIEELVSLL